MLDKEKRRISMLDRPQLIKEFIASLLPSDLEAMLTEYIDQDHLDMSNDFLIVLLTEEL